MVLLASKVNEEDFSIDPSPVNIEELEFWRLIGKVETASRRGRVSEDFIYFASNSLTSLLGALGNPLREPESLANKLGLKICTIKMVGPIEARTAENFGDFAEQGYHLDEEGIYNLGPRSPSGKYFHGVR